MILVTRADATFVNLALLADSAITLHFIVRQQIYELFAITTNICEIFTIYSHNIVLYLTNVVSFKDGSELDYLAEAVVNVVPVLGEVDSTEAEAVVAVFVVSFGEVDVGHGIDHDAVGLQGVGALRVFLVVDVTLYLGDVFATEFHRGAVP